MSISGASSFPRRFVCGECGHAHAAWQARCKSCFSLKGLVMVSGDDPVRAAPSVSPVVVAPPALPAIEARVELPAPPTDPRCCLASGVPPYHHAIDCSMAASPVVASPSPPLATILRLVPTPDPTLEPDELVDEDPLPEDEPSSVPISLADVAEDALPRDSTGLAPLDAVLGGGLAEGSVVALAGSAGCGKSTITMQMLAGLNLRALLATGEESVQQAGARARRIGAAMKKVLIVAETDLSAVIAHARKTRAQVLMVDSIQTLIHPKVKSAAGSPAQVRECTKALVKFAKDTGTPVIVTAHMTNDDRMAGPTTLRHLVDVVLELESGARFNGNERILRCVGKNRFGPSNVVGHFEMTSDGFVPVDGDGWGEEL